MGKIESRDFGLIEIAAIGSDVRFGSEADIEVGEQMSAKCQKQTLAEERVACQAEGEEARSFPAGPLPWPP